MEKSVIKVDGMSCEHCVKAVGDAVGALPGVCAVDVDLKAGTAAVEYDPAKCTVDGIRLAIEEQGFDAV